MIAKLYKLEINDMLESYSKLTSAWCKTSYLIDQAPNSLKLHECYQSKITALPAAAKLLPT